MRLAILSDIHGNILALDAVLADLGRRQVDAIVNLGDCASGPLWPRETMDLLLSKSWPTVRGNHDRLVGAHDRDTLPASDAYAYDALDQGARDWLRDLPTRLDLGHGIAAVHGRPDRDTTYLLKDIEDGRLVRAPAAKVASRAVGIEGRILLCGHSHQPRVMRLLDGRWVVNPGSVGCPAYETGGPDAHRSEAGSPAARYAVLELAGDRVGVELVALPYDHDRAAERATDNGRPEWAHALATGFCPPKG